MSRPSQVMVLTEDARHQRFVRQYLYTLDLTMHDIRFEPLPSGRGCGEQWVRERYATAVEAFRRRSPRATTWLIVANDADTGTVDRRLRQLSEAPRAADEAIAHLIPKRHIETWILCLNGERVDEETDYHRREVDGQIKAAASALFDWSRPNAVLPEHCVDSLRLAIPEVQRLG